MNNLDKQYTDLLQTILDYGIEKKDRTGTGTKSIFGYTIRHNMKDGFPLLTTKKMYTKGIIAELLWFLRGDTNIKYLVDNDCHIWDGDAYQGYLKRVGDGLEPATKERFIEMIKNGEESRVDANGWRIGELGPIYGKQWRKWTSIRRIIGVDGGGTVRKVYPDYGDIDQIANLINDIKTNPDSRRLMVSAWNVGELDSMTLPPCHYGFQVYTRELSFEERWGLAKKYGYIKGDIEMPTEDSMYMGLSEMKTLNSMWNDSVANTNLPTRAISLMWNQRSVDTFLGLPFNIASYGLLLEIIAKAVNMVPDELIGNLGDVHLYSNHIEQAKEQIGSELDIIERINYGVDVLGYESLLDYGHSQNEDELITTLCDEWGVPKRTREPYPLPRLVINDEFWNPDASLIEQIEHIKIEDFDIRGYKSHPTIKAPLSN